MIFEVLAAGAHKATKESLIAAALQVTRQEVAEIVSQERIAGRPICETVSSNPGYFLPEDMEHMHEYLNRQKLRRDAIAEERRKFCRPLFTGGR